MQCAVIEFARHVAGLAAAHSMEFNPETTQPVIDLLAPSHEEDVTSIRLGANPAPF